MEILPQGRQADTPTKLHVCEPPSCKCCTAGTGKPRKGVEEEVIVDADKGIKQQANGRRQNTLFEGEQWKIIDAHMTTGTVAHSHSRS